MVYLQEKKKKRIFRFNIRMPPYLIFGHNCNRQNMRYDFMKGKEIIRLIYYDNTNNLAKKTIKVIIHLYCYQTALFT